MTSFFQNMQKTRLRENQVKDDLLEALNVAVKKVQIYKELEENDCFVTSEDAGKELVLVLEAMFIHGARETFADRISSALGDPDRRPTPEFWSPMMIFTHPHIISQVSSLSQITNDVGRSRAWIRLCLNEGNFLGYLLSISQDMKTLKRFYKNVALLMDRDRLNMAMGFFQGVTQFRFSFPSNSSMFNYWSNEVLLKAGFWVPAMKESQLPVSVEFDVAQAMEAAPAPSSDSESANSFSSSTIQKLSIDDDDVLNLILKTPLNTPPVGSPLLERLQEQKLPEGDIAKNPTSTTTEAAAAVTTTKAESSSSQTETDDDQKHPPRLNPFDDTPDDSEPPEELPPLPQTPSSAQRTFDDNYDKVLESFDQPNKPNPLVPLSQLEVFVENYLRTPEPEPQPKPRLVSPGDSDVKVEESFVIVEKPSISTKPSDFKYLVDLIISGKITQEPGLDSQGFCCKECLEVIGISSTKARVCSMSGFYYCVNCFKNQEYVIPARIIHNWDFMKYPVSPHSYEFLSGSSKHPLINIRSTNPRLYFAVEEMDVTHKLRLKLNLLRQYLFTCRDSAKDRLQAMFWPREYLFEHVHLYSIDDLLEVAEGSLSVLLQKAIRMTENHVRSCVMCSQKGFICELCRTPESPTVPIFPFDIENVYKCSRCKSIYHQECMKNAEDGCPKCLRISLRKLQIERNLSEES